MPNSVAASTHDLGWFPREKDIKRYVHFDRLIPVSKIVKIANDRDLVARHPFFPLLKFEESWTKFREDGVRNVKVRPLRYAARLDAAIFARYRAAIVPLYERKLAELGLSEVAIAYRKIAGERGSNKSNIDFAFDVFKFIADTGDSYATVVDIKSYFESLDHGRILAIWESLVGKPLPADHLAVYQAVTKYCVVDLERLFERLELRQKPTVGTRTERRQRKIDALKSAGYRQICSPKEFRDTVRGTGSLPSLLQKNGFDFGIPQGLPISDLIANFYLIDFDKEVSDWVAERQGLYRRYSDDIVIVVPKRKGNAELDAKEFLQKTIKRHGSHMKIQDKKVCVSSYERAGLYLNYSRGFGKSSKNGLEYLGFEFDGRRVKLKDSTMSNAWRRMKRRAYGGAVRFVKRFRAKGKSWLIANYPFDSIETKILRNVTVGQNSGVRSWTFVKYVARANKTFIGLNPGFSDQTQRYRRLTKSMIRVTFDRALTLHCS